MGVDTIDHGLALDAAVGPMLVRGLPDSSEDGPSDEGIARLKISQVLSMTTTVPAGQWRGGTVACPEGTIVTGGGVFAISSERLRVTDSFAFTDLSGWVAWVHNTDANAHEFRVQAVCLSASTAG